MSTSMRANMGFSLLGFGGFSIVSMNDFCYISLILLALLGTLVRRDAAKVLNEVSLPQ